MYETLEVFVDAKVAIKSILQFQVQRPNYLEFCGRKYNRRRIWQGCLRDKLDFCPSSTPSPWITYSTLCRILILNPFENVFRVRANVERGYWDYPTPPEGCREVPSEV